MPEIASRNNIERKLSFCTSEVWNCNTASGHSCWRWRKLSAERKSASRARSACEVHETLLCYAVLQDVGSNKRCLKIMLVTLICRKIKHMEEFLCCLVLSAFINWYFLFQLSFFIFYTCHVYIHVYFSILVVYFS